MAWYKAAPASAFNDVGAWAQKYVRERMKALDEQRRTSVLSST